MHAKSIKQLKKWEVSYWPYTFFYFLNCKHWFCCRHIGWHGSCDVELCHGIADKENNTSSKANKDLKKFVE